MRKRSESAGQSSHAGFSLIVVLIIAVIGMALIGVTFYIYDSSVGHATVAIQRSLEYNAMQAGLERAKSALVLMCDNENTVPRWYDVAGRSSTISGPADLVIEGGTFTENVRVGGKDARLVVEIFDAGYAESSLAASVDNEMQMPPAQQITGDINDSQAIGSYLIRATLTIDGEAKQMETLLFQRNRVESVTSGGSSSGGGDDGDGNTNP